MIDPITIRHGFRNIPNTHQNGSQRIDYYFCTDLINNFIKLCAITPLNFFLSANHRGRYIDIQLEIFLRDPFKPIILPSSRLLTPKKLNPYAYTTLDYSNISQQTTSYHELIKSKKYLQSHINSPQANHSKITLITHQTSLDNSHEITIIQMTQPLFKISNIVQSPITIMQLSFPSVMKFPLTNFLQI